MEMQSDKSIQPLLTRQIKVKQNCRYNHSFQHAERLFDSLGAFKRDPMPRSILQICAQRIRRNRAFLHQQNSIEMLHHIGSVK
jgi:hypothetical protein